MSTAIPVPVARSSRVSASGTRSGLIEAADLLARRPAPITPLPKPAPLDEPIQLVAPSRWGAPRKQSQRHSVIRACVAGTLVVLAISVACFASAASSSASPAEQQEVTVAPGAKPVLLHAVDTLDKLAAGAHQELVTQPRDTQESATQLLGHLETIEAQLGAFSPEYDGDNGEILRGISYCARNIREFISSYAAGRTDADPYQLKLARQRLEKLRELLSH